MSKINSSKTPGILIAEIRMLRTAGYNGIFTVLEGPDDFKFWKGHLKIPREALVQAEGVINLRGCMQNLPASVSAQVCAIADKDFTQYLSVNPFAGCVNTFFYDEGFLETFLVNSPALAKILAHHGVPQKIVQFQHSNGFGTVYSYARRVANSFAKLRIINDRNGFGVCFKKKFVPYKYLCSTSWNFNEQALFNDFASHVGWSIQQLANELAKFSSNATVQLVHGHDLMKILVIGLKKPIGDASIGEDSLAEDLMLAFHDFALRHKVLTKNLRSWAGNRLLM